MHALTLLLDACSPATLEEAAAAAAGTEDRLSSVGSGDAPSAESSTLPFVQGAPGASWGEADERCRPVSPKPPSVAVRRARAAWQGSPGSAETPAGLRIWTPRQRSEHECWDLGRARRGEDDSAHPALGSGRAGSGSQGSSDPPRMESLREGSLQDASAAEEPKGSMYVPSPRDGSANVPGGESMEPDLAWPAPPQMHARSGARGIHCSGDDFMRQSSKVGDLALSSLDYPQRAALAHAICSMSTTWSEQVWPASCLTVTLTLTLLLCLLACCRPLAWAAAACRAPARPTLGRCSSA